MCSWNLRVKTCLVDFCPGFMKSCARTFFKYFKLYIHSNPEKMPVLPFWGLLKTCLGAHHCELSAIPKGYLGITSLFSSDCFFSLLKEICLTSHLTNFCFFSSSPPASRPLYSPPHDDLHPLPDSKTSTACHLSSSPSSTLVSVNMTEVHWLLSVKFCILVVKK